MPSNRLTDNLRHRAIVCVGDQTINAMPIESSQSDHAM
jgi:hypothetical protein